MSVNVTEYGDVEARAAELELGLPVQTMNFLGRAREKANELLAMELSLAAVRSELRMVGLHL